MQRLLPRRTTAFRVTAFTRPASSFNRPAPPKLPAEQQAEFERLQRDAAVSSAFQPAEQQEPPASSESTANSEAKSDENVNAGMFRGAKPEFEGETNPKTGEVGGPKNEPLRWGGGGDWSYNGRVTDF